MTKPHPNIWLPYAQMQNLQYIPNAVKTSGSKIFLNNKKVLIDGIASWWTACHGYNNKKIIKSIIDQANKMPHIMFGGFSDEYLKLSSITKIETTNNIHKLNRPNFILLKVFII